jgi:hypothetical protein
MIACGLLPGLFVRPIDAAGRDGDARTGARPLKANSSLGEISVSPNLDHVDHFPMQIMSFFQFGGSVRKVLPGQASTPSLA